MNAIPDHPRHRYTGQHRTRQPPAHPRLVRPRRPGHHPRAPLPCRHLLRQALRQPRDRAGDGCRGAGPGRRRADPPALPALDEARPRLDPRLDGGSRERAHAPDDLHRDRASEPARARPGARRAGGFFTFFLLLYLLSRAHRASPGRLFRGTSGGELHAVPAGNRRRPRGKRPAPKIARDYWQLACRRDACATWCWRYAPTRPVIATSTMASPTSCSPRSAVPHAWLAEPAATMRCKHGRALRGSALFVVGHLLD